MTDSNFSFLHSYHPKLTDLGKSAEKYAHSDPQSCIVKLRCFAELYIAFIYRELNLPLNGATNLFERLDNVSFKQAVEKGIIDKLHFLRMKGNKAAHPEGVSVQDATDALKEAHHLSVWLYLAYHNGSVNVIPSYKEPTEQPPAKAGGFVLRTESPDTRQRRVCYRSTLKSSFTLGSK